MVGEATNNNNSTSPSSHLETIDYKPADKPTMQSDADYEEKKTADGNNHHHHDDDDIDDDDDDDAKFDLYSEEAEWDEGGKSHCGYAEAVHNALMSVGETVHGVVGEPDPRIEKELKAVGNWFQEASYAARDLFGKNGHGKNDDDDDDDGEGRRGGNGGDNGMSEDAMNAVKTLLGGSGSKDEEYKRKENGDYQAPAPNTTTTTTTPSSSLVEPTTNPSSSRP